MWGFRFVDRSLFPIIDIRTIFEMEFSLNWYLHINNFDSMSYLEFLWKFERLKQEVEKTNEGIDGMTSLENLLGD